MCKAILRNAGEVIARDPALVFQAFAWFDRDLGREAFAIRINRSANHGGIARIDEFLMAYDHEHPLFLRVSGGIQHEVELALFIIGLEKILPLHE